MGVALDGVVAVDLNPQGGEALAEGLGGGLAGVLGNYHAAHIELHPPEDVDQAEHVLLIGDAQIAADLVFFDVPCADGD